MELGPAVRIKPKLQMERIYDKIESRISPVFPQNALSSPRVKANLKEYIRSGDLMCQSQSHNFSSTFSSRIFKPSQIPKDESALSGMTSFRDSKLGNNVCVIPPAQVMSELHKKSYFKGATGLLLGQESSLEMRKSAKLAELFT